MNGGAGLIGSVREGSTRISGDWSRRWEGGMVGSVDTMGGLWVDEGAGVGTVGG